MVRAPIGYRIRERRKQLGLTQAALARTLEISAPYLNLIEANRRNVGGRLLVRIARALQIDVATLNGATEQRLLDQLEELRVHPLVCAHAVEADFGLELVGRYPNWTRALLALYRAQIDSTATVQALADRLNRDPVLAESVHQMLTHITAVRSAAEILEEEPDLSPEQSRRFLALVANESRRLSLVAQSVVGFFQQDHSERHSVTEGEEVDDLLVAHRAHFPALEEAAMKLRGRLPGDAVDTETALVGFLAHTHGVSVVSGPQAMLDGARPRNGCVFERDADRLVFVDGVAPATRRFQLARVAAELSLGDAIAAELPADTVRSDAARARATHALAAYVAGALLLPYEIFLADAERVRYDIERLRQMHDASFEQVCHRLVTLRRPGAEGVPFAFVRADPAGFVTKPFPVPGLPVPRHGHACPLWPVFTCFQTPGRLVRQLAEMPDGSRFLLVASTVGQRAASFHEPQFLQAVMLGCDLLHAERTVYADGLLGSGAMPTPVGSSCRLCPRLDCRHRQQDAIVYTG